MFAALVTPLIEADRDLSGSAIRAAINTKLVTLGLQNTRMTDDFIYRVKKCSFIRVHGPRSQWFCQFRGWADAVRAADADNIIVIEEADNVYIRCFVCLAIMRRLVRTELLRPICSIDAAHCKLPSSGQLVSLCSWDADNNLLLLAFGHVQVESADNWSWFLFHCVSAMPTLASRHFVVISDGDKGIAAAVMSVLPNSPHVLCAQHLLKHVLSKANTCEGGRKDLEKLFWQAVRVCHPDYFVDLMQTMKVRHPSAFDYLTKEIALEKWAPAALEVPRWGKLTSSLSESCNASVLRYRSTPVPTMIDSIMVWSTQRLINISAEMNSLPLMQLLVPSAKAALQKAIDEGRTLTVRNANGGMAQVSSMSRGPMCFHAVDISDNKLCTTSCCQRWKSTALPCRHMAALCRAVAVDPVSLVHSCYFVDTEKALLNAALPARPVDTSQLTRDVHQMLPPNEQKQRGAPKKRRIPSWHDETTEKKRVVKCGRCGEEGHYRRGCKVPLLSQQ